MEAKLSWNHKNSTCFCVLSLRTNMAGEILNFLAWNTQNVIHCICLKVNLSSKCFANVCIVSWKRHYSFFHSYQSNISKGKQFRGAEPRTKRGQDKSVFFFPFSYSFWSLPKLEQVTEKKKRTTTKIGQPWIIPPRWLQPTLIVMLVGFTIHVDGRQTWLGHSLLLILLKSPCMSASTHAYARLSGKLVEFKMKRIWFGHGLAGYVFVPCSLEVAKGRTDGRRLSPQRRIVSPSLERSDWNDEKLPFAHSLIS